jgi:hypothetical protein
MTSKTNERERRNSKHGADGNTKAEAELADEQLERAIGGWSCWSAHEPFIKVRAAAAIISAGFGP